MAAFNLTAELNLRGPSNINQVVGNIRRQLSTLTLDLNINPNTSRGVQAVTANIRTLSTALRDAQSNAAALSSTLSNLVASINNVGNAANNAGTSINRLNTQTRNTQNAARDGATAMEDFGRQSALAIRRFAAFSVATGAVYGFVRALSSAYSEFVNFNKEFVRLQQVTNSTASGLSGLANEITRLSTGLGVSSAELLKVSTTLAQAGLSATQTKTALEALAKSALAPSFDNLNDTVEGSIALLRQFGLGAGDLESALGSINAVAAKFAVEAGDIITAIQRTGGVFASASKGVSQGKDALNEFIAVFTSVRATTRESAETIATGLRTIFTRIQRGNTIQALKEYGITLTDLEGKFVGPYEAVRRLSEGLKNLDPRDLRFSEIVEELGGFRQIGKVIPLIQQFATAQQALSVAQRGSGSLAADAGKAQEALAIRITKVREEFIALIRDIGQTQSFQKFVDISLQLASSLISVASAAKNVLPAIAAIAAIRAVPAIAQFAGGFGRNLTRRNSGGPISRFATGGLVPGSGSGDTVPAMLTPGEFVIRKKAVESIGASRLHSLNKYASGGKVKQLLPVKASLSSKYDTSDDIEDLYSLISIDRKKSNKLSKTREKYREQASQIWNSASDLYSKTGSISLANRFIRRKVGINLPSKLKSKELDRNNTDSQRLNKIQGSLAEKDAYNRGNFRQLPTLAGADFSVGGSSTDFAEVKNRLDFVSDDDLKGKALLAHQYMSKKQYLNNKIDKTPRLKISLFSTNDSDYKRGRKYADGGFIQRFADGDYVEGSALKALKQLAKEFLMPKSRKGGKRKISFLGQKAVSLSKNIPPELMKQIEKEGRLVYGTGLGDIAKGDPGLIVDKIINVAVANIRKQKAGRLKKTQGALTFSAAGLQRGPRAPAGQMEKALAKYQQDPEYRAAMGLDTGVAGGFLKQFEALAKAKNFTSPKTLLDKLPNSKTKISEFRSLLQQQLKTATDPKEIKSLQDQIKKATTALDDFDSYMMGQAPKNAGRASHFAWAMRQAVPESSRFAKGGNVHKFAAGGSAQDTVPALLTPGEFVINKKAASRLGSQTLHKLNNADKISGFNKGGAVGDVQSFAGGGIVQSFFIGGAVQAATQLSRLLPQFATAVAQALRLLPRNLPQGAGWLGNNAGTRAMGLPGRMQPGNIMRGLLRDPMALVFGSGLLGEGVGNAIGGATGNATSAAVSSGAGIAGVVASIVGVTTPFGLLATVATGAVAGFQAWNKALRDSKIEENNKKIESSSESLSQALDKLSTSSNVSASSLDSIKTTIATLVSAQQSNLNLRNEEAQPGFLSNLFGPTAEMFGFSGVGRIDDKALSASRFTDSKTASESITRTVAEFMKKGMTFEQASAATGQSKDVIRRNIAIGQRGTEITDLEAKLAQAREDMDSSYDKAAYEPRVRALEQRLNNTINRANEEYKKEQDALNNVTKATTLVVSQLNLFAEAMKNVESATSRASAQFEEAQRQIDISIGSSIGGESTISKPSRLNENVLQNLRAYSNTEISGAINQLGQNLNLSPQFTQRTTGAALSQRVLETELPRILSGISESERQGIWGAGREQQVTDQLTKALGLSGVSGNEAKTIIDEVLTNLNKLGKGEVGIDDLISNSAALSKLYKSNSEAIQSINNIMQAYNGTMEAVVSRLNQYVSALESSINAQIQASQIRAGGDLQLREALGGRIGLSERNSLFNQEIMGMTSTIGAGNRPIAGTGTTDPGEIARRLAAAEQKKKDIEAQAAQSGGNKFAAQLTQVTLQIRQYENALKKLSSDTSRASNALSEIGRLRQLRETKQESFLDFASNASGPDGSEFLINMIRRAGAFGNVMSGRGTTSDIGDAREAFKIRANSGFVPADQLEKEKQQLIDSILNIYQKAGVQKPILDALRQQLTADFGSLTEEKDAINEFNTAIKAQAEATALLGKKTEDGANYLYTQIVKAANDFVARISQAGIVPQVAAGVANNASGGLIYANKGRLINFQPKGTDTVPAMLTPGEFVVNAKSTKQHLGLLQQINDSGKIGGYSNGGVVYLADGGLAEERKRRREEFLAEKERRRQAFLASNTTAAKKEERKQKEKEDAFSSIYGTPEEAEKAYQRSNAPSRDAFVKDTLSAYRRKKNEKRAEMMKQAATVSPKKSSNEEQLQDWLSTIKTSELLRKIDSYDEFIREGTIRQWPESFYDLSRADQDALRKGVSVGSTFTDGIRRKNNESDMASIDDRHMSETDAMQARMDASQARLDQSTAEREKAAKELNEARSRYAAQQATQEAKKNFDASAEGKRQAAEKEKQMRDSQTEAYYSREATKNNKPYYAYDLSSGPKWIFPDSWSQQQKSTFREEQEQAKIKSQERQQELASRIQKNSERKRVISEFVNSEFPEMSSQLIRESEAEWNKDKSAEEIIAGFKARRQRQQEYAERKKRNEEFISSTQKMLGIDPEKVKNYEGFWGGLAYAGDNIVSTLVDNLPSGHNQHKEGLARRGTYDRMDNYKKKQIEAGNTDFSWEDHTNSYVSGIGTAGRYAGDAFSGLLAPFRIVTGGAGVLLGGASMGVANNQKVLGYDDTVAREFGKKTLSQSSDSVGAGLSDLNRLFNQTSRLLTYAGVPFGLEADPLLRDESVGSKFDEKNIKESGDLGFAVKIANSSRDTAVSMLPMPKIFGGPKPKPITSSAPSSPGPIVSSLSRIDDSGPLLDDILPDPSALSAARQDAIATRLLDQEAVREQAEKAMFSQPYLPSRVSGPSLPKQSQLNPSTTSIPRTTPRATQTTPLSSNQSRVLDTVRFDPDTTVEDVIRRLSSQSDEQIARSLGISIEDLAEMRPSTVSRRGVGRASINPLEGYATREQLAEEVLKRRMERAGQYNKGGIIYASKGQYVPYRPKGTDTVPAMLTPGEFVVNKQATQRNLPLLKAMNNNSQYLSNGGKVQYFREGSNGPVSGSSGSSGGVSSFVLDSSEFTNSMSIFSQTVGELKSSLDSFANGAGELNKGATAISAAFGGISTSVGALSGAATILQGAASALISPITKFTTSLEAMSSVLQRIPTDINLNIKGAIPPISITVDINGGQGLEEQLKPFANEIYTKIGERLAQATNGNLKIETTTFS